VDPNHILKAVDEPLSESCFPRQRGQLALEGAFAQNSDILWRIPMKRVLAVLLCFMMTASLLSGCGGAAGDMDSPSGQDAVDTPAPAAPFTDADGDPVADVAVNTAGADALIRWLLLPETLELAAGYGREEFGDSLFYVREDVPACPGPVEAAAEGTKTIHLSTTTSVNDSGLLPVFEEAYGYTVEIQSAGTGKAIAAAKYGNAEIANEVERVAAENSITASRFPSTPSIKFLTKFRSGMVGAAKTNDTEAISTSTRILITRLGFFTAGISLSFRRGEIHWVYGSPVGRDPLRSVTVPASRPTGRLRSVRSGAEGRLRRQTINSRTARETRWPKAAARSLS